MEDSEKSSKSQTCNCARFQNESNISIYWKLALLLFGSVCVMYLFSEIYRSRIEIKSLRSDVEDLQLQLSNLIVRITKIQPESESLERSRRSLSRSRAMRRTTEESTQASTTTVAASTTSVPSGDSGRGAIFTRWGKRSCPGNSLVVYSGYAAAADPWYGMGGSTELECLSENPSWHSNSLAAGRSNTKIFPAKFARDGGVIRCAVCFTSNAPVMMIPGQTTCRPGWQTEYSGDLMASPAISNALYFSSKNYCVDRSAESYSGHQNNALGFRLTFLLAGRCFQGKAPCNRYRENRRLACTVCSKSRQ